MEELEEDKLHKIGEYIYEEMYPAKVHHQEIQPASPAYVFIIETVKQQHRLEVCRPLIEDQNISVSKLEALMISHGLAQQIQQFDRPVYSWTPII